MKANINSTLIKNLPEGADLDIYDTKLTGFVLRLRKSGTHSYRVQYARGKWLNIGRVGVLKPAEARDEAQKVLGEAAKGNDPGAARRRSKAATLRDYVNNIYGPWVTTHRKDGKATLGRIKSQFDRDMGGTRLPDLTPWSVEKWRSARLKAGIKPATINRDLNALKAAIGRAVEWGYLDINPLTKVKPSKVDDNGLPRFLSDAEELRLRSALDKREETARRERESANQWRATRGYPLMPDLRAVPFVDHLRPLVLLAINTGMRRGELFNLTWKDVDLPRAMLVVRGEGAKSGKTRHIPLNAEAVTVLEGWRESSDGKNLVFPGTDGERMDNITSSWGKLVKDAKVRNFRFHDLRHSFASKLVMAGVDLNTVRELLGHADLKMTLRYAHLAPEHKAAAVARLNAPKAKEGAA